MPRAVMTTSKVTVHEEVILKLPQHLCSSSILTLSPSRIESFLNVNRQDELCVVQFVPHEIGEWTLMTSSSLPQLSSSPPSSALSSSPTPFHPSASPFKVRVFDHSGVCVVCAEEGVMADEFKFIVDASETNNKNKLFINLKINNSNIPVNLKIDQLSSIYSCTFQPIRACQYKLNVNYDGAAVMGSPYNINIHSTTTLSLLLRDVVVRVNRICHLDVVFNKVLRDGDDDDVDAVVTSPQNRQSHIQTLIFQPDRVNNNTVRVSFVPIAVGRHILQVYHNNNIILGSPVTYSAYNPDEVVVVCVSKVVLVGETFIFDVDTSRGGEGHLEVKIDKGHTTNHVQLISKCVHRVRFVARDVMKHDVDVRFNSEPVPECPFEVWLTDETTTTNFSSHCRTGTSGYKDGVDGGRNGVNDGRDGVDGGRNSVDGGRDGCSSGRHGCSSGKDGCSGLDDLIRNDDSVVADVDISSIIGDDDVMLVAVGQKERFKLLQIGLVDLHKLSILFVRQSTLTTSLITDVATSSIAALNDKVVAAKVKRQNPDNEKDLCEVVFEVPQIGDYTGHIEYSGIVVGELPFKVKSYDLNKIKVKGVKDGQVQQESSFIVDAAEAGEGDMIVSIEKYQNSNMKMSSHVVTISRSRFKVIYTPTKSGLYKVNVLFNDRVISGKPIFFEVFDQSRITLNEPSTNRMNLHKPVAILLDAEDCDVTDFKAFLIDTDNKRTQAEVVASMVPSCQMFVRLFPPLLGEHTLHVTHKERTIHGSPLKLYVYDPDKVKVRLNESSKLKQPIIIEVDQSSAGEGEVQLKVTKVGHPFETLAVHQSDMVYEVTPQSKGTYHVQVLFNHDHVKGSPFKVVVKSDLKVTFESEGNLEVNKSSCIQLRMCEGEENVCFDVTDEKGEDVPYQLTNLINDLYKLTLTPKKVGKIKIKVKKIGSEEDEVMISDVTDLAQTRVVNFPLEVILGDEAVFEVDTSGSGEGHIDVRVEAASSNYTASVTPINKSLKKVTFNAKEVGYTRVHISFNGKVIPDSPYKCHIHDVNLIRPDWTSLSNSRIHQTSHFTINQHQSHSTTHQPHSTTHQPHSTTNQPHSTTNQPLELHAFSIIINDPQGDRVRSSILHRPSDSNRGQSVLVRFVPNKVGQHRIEVRYLGHKLEGSPRFLDVFGENIKKKLTMETMTDHLATSSLQTQTDNPPDFSKAQVVVTAPNGDRLSGRLLKELDGKPKVDFISPYGGDHHIEVLLNSQHLLNTTTHLLQPSRVSVVAANKKWILKEEVDFEVSTETAGNAELKIKIVDPKGNNLHYKVLKVIDDDCDDGDDNDGDGVSNSVADDKRYVKGLMFGEGRYRVMYTVHSQGPHRSYISYGGVPVPAAHPLVQDVIAANKAYCSGQGLSGGVVGEKSTFMVYGGSKKKDLFVRVAGPEGIAGVVMEAVSDTCYNVAYTPVVVGVYVLSVMCASSHLQGSPYQAMVTDPSKVKFVGGLDEFTYPISKVLTLKLGQINNIKLDTSLAGSGKITGDILYGSGRVEGCGTYEEGAVCVLVCVPVELGEHLIRILFNNNPIRHCPLRTTVIPCSERSLIVNKTLSASQVIVCGRGLKEARVNEMVEFVVDGRSDGRIKVRLVGVKGEAPVHLTHVNQTGAVGGLYKCVYTIHKAGIYELHVDWMGEGVTGSPFKIIVPPLTDAAKVVCSGEGLKRGVLGEDIRASIDCSRAGPGDLQVFCKSKTGKLTHTLIQQNKQTYKLLLTPSNVGRYNIAITYASRAVDGSPFDLKVSSAADATKVKVYGPGVRRHGRLGEFKGHFFADTRGAGSGELKVRVRGPKGAFCVDVSKLQHRLVACRYDPTEVGEYVLQVKWAESNVTGSPFKVIITS